MASFYGMIGVAIFLAGGALLHDLGAGRVPGLFKPVADAWARAGHDTKWVRAGLWTLFALLALAMLFFVGIPLYSSVVGLGARS